MPGRISASPSGRTGAASGVGTRRRLRQKSPLPRPDPPGDPVIEELAARVRSGDVNQENLERIRELLIAATRGDQW